MSQPLQTVHVRINDAGTGQPTPCRVRFTGPDGTYYAPFGRLTEFACDAGKDVGGNLWLVTENKKYAYINGACEIELPPGPIHLEVSKGFEYRPIDETIDLKQGQLSIRLSIERWYDARKEGWYSGDIHVEYMTPHAALLEAMAEDVAIVNLLARATFNLSTDEHPHPAIPNIDAFSGQVPALEKDGHLVVVNTLNWHPYFGQLLLLNCHRVIYPLYFGAAGEPDNWTLGAWCDQCHRKGGLVIADESRHQAQIILGKVDAVEVLRVFLPGLGNLFNACELWSGGFRFALVAGSRKRSNQDRLGRPRTYALLNPGEQLSYSAWIEAVRAGRTFVTEGVLLFLLVNGQPPGSVIELDEPGQVVSVEVAAVGPESGYRVILSRNGAKVATAEAEDGQTTARIDHALPFNESGWITAFCDGRYIAWSSPVYVNVRGTKPRIDPEALERLSWGLEFKMQWIEDSARCEDDRQRERLLEEYRLAEEELTRRQSTGE